MTKQFITNYIENKLEENEKIVRYTFYELRVKNNLSAEEVEYFLKMNKNYFENKGYKVYCTGERFVYNNANRTVQDNELMIAIKG